MRRRRGLSLLEALLAAVLFVVLLVPVVLIYGSSNRVGYAADRMLDATLHGQTLLESLAALEDHELPPVPAGASVPLFVDDPDAALSAPSGGGSGRWDEVAAWLELPPPFPMTRVVTAERLASGPVVLRVEIAWLALPGRPETGRVVTLQTLASPTLWQ
jgi:hypothetical protein